MADLMLRDVGYHYPKTKHVIFSGVQARFPAGTVTSIRGQSDAGKSTLLYLIAGLETPTEGQLLWDGKPIEDLSAYRRRIAGMISQSYLLFPTRTALENVCYPLTLDKVPKQEAIARAASILRSIGIGEELFHRLPEKLSGGEQQRVAIARCLAANSQIIAADEPTGNLDEANAQNIVDLLLTVAHEEGKTVIIVTHDPDIAAQADVQLTIRGGELFEST